MKIKILKQYSKYFPWVVDIIKERWSVSEREAKDEVRRWVTDGDNSVCFVGVVNQRPVAFGVFDTQSNVDASIKAWNRQVFVEPDFRGNEYGYIFTQKRWEWAKEKGYQSVYLVTEIPDYHARYGWKRVRKVKDGVIMKYDIE